MAKKKVKTSIVLDRSVRAGLRKAGKRAERSISYLLNEWAAERLAEQRNGNSKQRKD